MVGLADLLPFGITPDDFYVLLLALATFVVVWAVGAAFVQPDTLTPRLQAIQERREELKAQYRSPQKRQRPQKHVNQMRAVVDKLKVLQESKTDDIERSLVQMGNRNKDAIVVFMFAQIVMPFVGLGVGFILSDLNTNAAFTVDEATNWLIIFGCAYACAKAPHVWLRNKRDKRYYAIQKALSDMLDLMMICAEAGLSLGASLDRVARELGETYPEMAEELSLTSVEMGFLPDRNTALKHLAERVDTQEVRGIVNVLAQTEKYGTPIAQALRVLSREFRTDRMLRAEQKAARLPALMTVPMIVFILPTLFVLVLTPAVIGIMDTSM